MLATEFNCLGPYGDDSKRACPELRFLNRHEQNSSLVGAYKVPSLRNAALTAPYMHDGRFATLAEVIGHYRNPIPSGAPIEFRPLFDMSPQHIEAIAAFLKTLSAPVAAPPEFLRAPQRAASASPAARRSCVSQREPVGLGPRLEPGTVTRQSRAARRSQVVDQAACFVHGDHLPVHAIAYERE